MNTSNKSTHSHTTDSHGSGAHEHGHAHGEHATSLSQELTCHLPYATFSVAFSFVVLSIVHFLSLGFSANARLIQGGYHVLFHAFHYLHLVFATAGTFVAFSRFSSNWIRGAVISLVSPAIFCTLSDIALPAIAMQILGVSMHLHICFFSWTDTMNVIPFMIVGLITGAAIAKHYSASLNFVSLSSHFVHILISSLAATFYTVSSGFSEWNESMGLLFFMLVIAVVIPCTISDVIVPMYFSRQKSKAK
jgi:hypothetical protein